MSIVKVIENVELERENNKALRDAMRDRVENLIGTVDNLHSQAAAHVQHLLMLHADLIKARDAILQEMDNRDEALRVIIEGEGHAGV